MALPWCFFSTQSVLVIDNIDTIRSALKGMLQMLGCEETSVVASGERPLDLCENVKFDFILCDFNLGKGKDGYPLFEELKLQGLMKPNTVFILISTLLALKDQGLEMYKSGLYPASSSLFMEAYEIIPNNVQLALNLGQSLLKGWPSNESFTNKKRIAKHCVAVIEANQLDDHSKKRFHAIEYNLKEF